MGKNIIVGLLDITKRSPIKPFGQQRLQKDETWRFTVIMSWRLWQQPMMAHNIDNTGNKGGATYDYQVCEEKTSNSSSTVQVTF